MQLRAQRTFGQAGKPGDLFVSITNDVVKHEHAPRAGRQRGDGALQIDGLRDVDRRNASLLDRRRVILTFLASEADAGRAAVLAAGAHEQRVDGNAVQPGR